MNETGPDGSAFNLANWTFSGPNALDGETTNGAAATPFPIGAFTPPTVAGPQPTVINEVLVSTTGADVEFIEIFGEPGASLEGLSLVNIESDDDTGNIDNRFDLPAGAQIGDNGFYLIGNNLVAGALGVTPNAEIPADFFENSSSTIALLETASITGTTVDGTETVVDAVALADTASGTFYYDAPVLGPDGTFYPSAVGRSPDGGEFQLIDAFSPAGVNTTPTAGDGFTGGGDPAILIATADGSIDIAEGGAVDSFEVTLNTAPSGDVVVTIAPDGQSSVSPQTLTFTPDNFDTPQAVTVTAVDDDTAEGAHSSSISLSAAGAEFEGVTATATADVTDNDVALTAIYDIQGAGHTSPLVGQTVTTTGVVTAVDTNGFYLQDPNGDGDIATSDAIFLFTGSAPSVAVGDAIQVTGVVSEFTPGGVGTGNLSATQLSSLSGIIVESSGNALPAATIIGQGGRVPPSENIDDDAFASFDPTTDGADFFESLEAMLVTAQDVVAVSGTNRFGEIFTVANGGDDATGLSDRGTLNISPDDFNPEKIQIDEDTGILPGFSLPEVNVGDKLGDVTGVVSYDFGNFQIHPTEAFTVTPSGLAPEVSNISGDAGTMTIASYNVLNLDVVIEDPANLLPGVTNGVDDDLGNGRFDAIANQIVNNLNAPDVIGLQEIQDNTGAEGVDSIISADATLQQLIDSIVAAGGPEYTFIDNSFIGDDTSGGIPGGNIRTAFLYDSSRVSVDNASIQTIGGQGAGEAFEGARLPLSAEFTFLPNGETVTVVNNHFSSKGGSAPIVGVEQPFEARQEDVSVNGSLDERQAQSQAVQDFILGELDANPSGNFVVLGDFNEFEFVSPILDLETNLGFTNLTNTLPEDERYSFNFQGNSQSLDHILVSEGLKDGAEFDIVHVNSEFAETEQRASDHDPLLVGLTFDEVVEPTPALEVGIFDSETDALITLIKEGDQIDSSLIAGKSVTISAVVPVGSQFEGQVESISLNLNGGQEGRTENVAPYALFGDIGGDFNGKADFLALGGNSIAFTLFPADNANGAPLDTVTLNFSVIDGSAVEPPAPLDDALTVAESEAAGDQDLNVLANDASGTGDPLTVATVGGQPAGSTVAGSNGGLFTILADGSLDFDANGDFDSLNSGQTATTSVEIGVGYENGAGPVVSSTVTVTVDGEDDGPVSTIVSMVVSDGEQRGDGEIDSTQTGADNDLEIGGGDTAGLLFEDVALPTNPAMIASAELVVVSQRDQTFTGTIDIALSEDTDIASPLSGQEAVTNDSFVFNLENVDPSGAGGDTFAAGEVVSLDVTGLVQDYYAQPGVNDADANDLLFSLGTENGVFRIDPEEVGEGAKLVITFTDDLIS